MADGEFWGRKLNANFDALDPSAEWIRCRPWIEAAVSRGDLYGIEDVERRIMDGEVLFWPGKRCAAITEFLEFPKARILNFWLLGGDLRELLEDMHPVIEDFARKMGCKRLTGVYGKGRRGWSRVLEKHGYAPFWTALGKEL